MVSLRFRRSDGVEIDHNVPAERAESVKLALGLAGLALVDESESDPGEIERAKLLKELKELLPKLRVLAASVKVIL